MALLDKINEGISQLEIIGWRLMQNDSHCTKMYKLSKETHIEGFCGVEKKDNKYAVFIIIQDPYGRSLYRAKREDLTEREHEAASYLKLLAAGIGEAYLSRQTNIKEIREVYDKYKRLMKLRK